MQVKHCPSVHRESCQPWRRAHGLLDTVCVCRNDVAGSTGAAVSLNPASPTSLPRRLLRNGVAMAASGIAPARPPVSGIRMLSAGRVPCSMSLTPRLCAGMLAAAAAPEARATVRGAFGGAGMANASSPAMPGVPTPPRFISDGLFVALPRPLPFPRPPRPRPPLPGCEIGSSKSSISGICDPANPRIGSIRLAAAASLAEPGSGCMRGSPGRCANASCSRAPSRATGAAL
mmetsp:Transcript_77281/g.145711  ORF Transcript_77281/g.145711 Transcript_77281/m.145711 type:complete len:231 (-) Transcript_77281:1727-2419(-)